MVNSVRLELAIIVCNTFLFNLHMLFQLIPYFVMETLSYPGLPGLFLACVAAGALR